MALPSKMKGETHPALSDKSRPFLKRREPESETTLKPKVEMETSNPAPNANPNASPAPNANAATAQPKPEPFNPNSVPSNFLQRDKLSELNLLRHQVSEMATLIDIGDMPADLLNILSNALEPHREIDFDEEFNVRDELVTQMKLVRSIRISLLKPGGALKDDTTVTEVKSVLDASMRLSDMLNKVNKDLVNQERIRAVEAAFMDVIGDMDKAVQIAYVESLEKRMKAQKALEKK